MTERKAIESALAWTPRWLAFQRDYMPFVGAQAAVRVDGDLLLDDAVGLADIQNNVPLTAHNLFRIASHSKTFTGVACMQLVEQGKLRLDDPACQHVPELDGTPMAGVTVRELLGHLSGMTRDGEDSSSWSLERRFPDREELLETIREHGKVLEPNEHFKYRDVGYSLLGIIIEAASGMSWREYVQESIVDRVGLKHTGPDLDESRLGELAKGYSSRVHGPERVEIEHIDTVAESSATGVFSNASDITAYFQAQLDGDDRLIFDGSKRRMRQVQWRISGEAQYGLGRSISEVNGSTYYGHSGGYPGHITMSKLDLERKLSISVVTNSNDGPAEKLTRAILHLIDLALDARVEARTEPKPAADVERFEGRLWVLNSALDNPAEEAFEMEIVSDTEPRMVGDKGFRGYGEVMRYHFRDDGTVDWVRGAGGHRLVPAERCSLHSRVARPA